MISPWQHEYGGGRVAHATAIEAQGLHHRFAMMGETNLEIGPHTEAFEVHGMRNGSIVRVAWVRGVLRGDPPTVDLLEIQADCVVSFRHDPLAVRAGLVGGDDQDASPLIGPESAFALIKTVIDRITLVTTPGLLGGG